MGGMLINSFVNLGLVLIFLFVLLTPLISTKVENNLEIFLLLNGLLAMTIASFAQIPGVVTGWRWEIVMESLISPIWIGEIFGIPIGIVQIVLIAGLVMYLGFEILGQVVAWIVKHVSLPVIVFFIIVLFGLLSSISSAIVTAILLVEFICFLPLCRSEMVTTTVIACFSIGLGAALTPLGEPLSTITVEKLAGPPYYAGFGYLIATIGYLVLPGILALGILGMMMMKRSGDERTPSQCHLYRETLLDVVIRALKVFVFIMALVFLGEGFTPLIAVILPYTPAPILYWFNIISAILDNATLASTEISPVLTPLQIKSALMGLLAAGVILIPGNIPNIIASGKLKISSKEWAKIGIPVGLCAMIIYFIAIFLPEYLRILL
jgi:predicted cation transporter